MGVYIYIGFFIVGLLFSSQTKGSHICTYPVAVRDDLCWVFYRGYYPCGNYRVVNVTTCCSGWTYVSYCTEACAEGYHGYDCAEECDCDDHLPCNPVDGSCGIIPCSDCPTGDNRYCNADTCECMPGWRGVDCNEPCYDGFYGQNCNQVCECVNGMCSNIDGECICNTGWIGTSCNRTCDAGFYGVECKDLCNCSLSSAACDPVNGTCDCPPGLYGDRCQTVCPPGFFGGNCSFGCICDANQVCDPVNGTCEDELTEAKPRTTKNGTVALGVSISAIILFLTIIVFGAIVMLWKRRIQKGRTATPVGEPIDHVPESPVGSDSNTTSPHPMYYNVEPEQDDRYSEVNTDMLSTPVHSYENTDESVHNNGVDDDGEYEMLREGNHGGGFQPRNNKMTSVGDYDSIKISLKKPRETSTDYVITAPYVPGGDEHGNYEEPSEFLPNGKFGNVSNEPKSPPSKMMHITSEAGYAIPVPKRNDDAPLKSHIGGKMSENPRLDSYYEDADIVPHQNGDVNARSNADYSKFNRNNIRNSGELDSGDDYGKLITSEFNESDEEYDTLGVIKHGHKQPTNANGNTYSALHKE